MQKQFAFAALAVLVSTAVALPAEPTPHRPPNIVFILADDLGCAISVAMEARFTKHPISIGLPPRECDSRMRTRLAAFAHPHGPA